jgi:hypothetical protein
VKGGQKAFGPEGSKALPALSSSNGADEATGNSLFCGHAARERSWAGY